MTWIAGLFPCPLSSTSSYAHTSQISPVQSSHDTGGRLRRLTRHRTLSVDSSNALATLLTIRRAYVGSLPCIRSQAAFQGLLDFVSPIRLFEPSAARKGRQ